MSELLTKETFLQKIFDYEHESDWRYQGQLPSVIDFYADWCGPCRMVAPVIDALSKEYQGRVNFYKIDTDREQELAAAFGIQSIPSLLFIPMEGRPQMAAGALPKNTMKEIIDRELLPGDGEAEAQSRAG